MQATTVNDFLVPDRNSFGAMRAAAALTVAVTHAIEIQAGNVAWDPVFQATGYTLGQHAVHVFFILSGLLVTASLCRSQGPVPFLLGRAFRIFPGLIVCAMLTAFVLGPVMSICATTDYLTDAGAAQYAIKTILLETGRAELPGVFVGNPLPGEINNSVWTLKYEVLCYGALALAAVAGLLTTQHRNIAVLGAVILGLGATFLLDGLIPANTPADVLRRFALCFALGTFAYFAKDRLVIGVPALVALGLAAYQAAGTKLSVPFTLGFEAYLVLWLASFGHARLARLTAKHDLSYGVYLYGWPISQSLLQLFPQMEAGWLAFVTLLLVLPVAALSWHLVEMPAQRFGKGLRSASPRPRWVRDGLPAH